LSKKGNFRVSCSKGWNVPKTCINWRDIEIRASVKWARLERRPHSCRKPAITCTGPHPKKPKK